MPHGVVVGGGVAGLATAARLAKLGYDVTLVERRSQLGGALGYVEQGGYRWDAGPSATTLPAALRDLFRKSGRPLDKEVELVELPLLREHRFGDGSAVALPPTRAAQRQALADALGEGAGEDWLAWTKRCGDAWDHLRRPVLETPRDPSDPPDRTTRALLRDRLTLHKATGKTLRDERLRSIARYAAVDAGHDPRDVPWWFGLVDYVEQSFGAWTVPGGLGGLAEVMTARLRTRGVTVLTETTVRDLDVHEAEQRVGVDTDAGILDADFVVVAVDPRSLPALRPHVRATTPALPPWVVHLGLAGDVPTLPAEVVLHGDPTFTVVTTGAAPAGHAAWTVRVRGRLGEDALVALARAGIDVRALVDVRVDRSPRQQVEELGGSSYGVLWQGRDTPTRQLRTRTPLPSVYAAGAATTIWPSLPFVALSAALVPSALPLRPVDPGTLIGRPGNSDGSTREL